MKTLFKFAAAVLLCAGAFVSGAIADEGAATKVRFGAALPSGASQWSIFTLTDGTGLYQCQHNPTCTTSGQWVAVGAGGGGGGANVALSNLSGVAINAALAPGQGSSLALRGFNDDNTHPATNVTITGGAAGTSGNPGNVTITGGTGSATSVAGGVVNIAGGPAGGGVPGGVNVSTPVSAPIVLSVGTKAYTSTSSDITLETQDLAGTGASSIYLLAGGASITTTFLPTIEILAGHSGVPGAIYLNAAVSGGANSGQIWMANSNFDYLNDNVTDFDLATNRPRDAFFGRNVYAGGAFIAGGGAVQTQLIGPYSGTAASSSGSGTLALTAGGAVQASFNGGAPQTLANVTSSISGQAGTALALAATPTQCSSSFATGIAANGNANCSTSDLITMNELTSRPTSLSGVGSLWFDATTHQLRYNQNLGSDVQIGLATLQNADTPSNSNPANILELQNGTGNPQALRIYQDWSGAGANYARMDLFYDGVDMVLMSEAGGTGTTKSLGLGTGSARRWEITTTTAPNVFRPATDNAYDMGDASHRIGNVTLGDRFAATGASVNTSVKNETVSGTTLNKLAKLTTASGGSVAITAGTGDTGGIVGIVTGTSGTAGSFLLGNATIARSGFAPCAFDATSTVAGDYVQISSTVAGDCHDAGSTLPTSGQIIGRVLDTGSASANHAVLVLSDTYGTTTGAGSVTSVTLTGDGVVLSSTPSSAVTTSGTLTAALANAGAGTVLGNVTGSSAAPGYTIAPVLGVAGSSVGTIGFHNATSGQLTLSPPTGALGSVTVTVPAATDTLVNLAGTQTLTGKSIAASEVNSGTLAIAQGGTNAATAANALISLFPTASEVGDLVYCSTYSSGCTAWSLLAGNTSGTKTLQETSAGVPSWATTPTTGTLVSGNYVSASGAQGVQDSGVTAGPYTTGWFTQLTAGNAGYLPSSGANKAMAWGITLTYPITTTQVTYSIGLNADNSATNNFDLGLYNSAGTLILNVSSGSLHGSTFAPATGAQTLSWVQGSTKLQPGNYYLFYYTNNVGATPATLSSPGATGFTFYKSEANGTGVCSITTQGSAGFTITPQAGSILPTSITPPANSYSWSACLPAIWIH